MRGDKYRIVVAEQGRHNLAEVVATVCQRMFSDIPSFHIYLLIPSSISLLWWWALLSCKRPCCSSQVKHKPVDNHRHIGVREVRRILVEGGIRRIEELWCHGQLRSRRVVLTHIDALGRWIAASVPILRRRLVVATALSAVPLAWVVGHV